MAEPGFEPRVDGWESRLLPLCYAAQPSSVLKNFFVSPCFPQIEKYVCKPDPKTEQVTLDWSDQKVQQVSSDTEVTCVTP